MELILRDAGATALLVTHDQEEALSLADRLAVMREGRIVQVGAPQEVYGRPANRWTAGFVGEVNVLAGVGRGTGVETELGVFDVGASTSGPPCTWRCGPSSFCCGRTAAATPRWSHASSAVTTCSTGCVTRAAAPCWCSSRRSSCTRSGARVFVRPVPDAVTCLVD